MQRKRPSEASEAVDVDLLASIRALGRLATTDEAPDPRVAERLQQIVDVVGLGQPEHED